MNQPMHQPMHGCTLAQMEQAAAELRRLQQSEREGWRHADELEQERKRLNQVNTKLLKTLKELNDEPGQRSSWIKAPAATAIPRAVIQQVLQALRVSMTVLPKDRQAVLQADAALRAALHEAPPVRQPQAVASDRTDSRQPLNIQEVEKILAQHNYEIHGDRARYIVRMTEAAHGSKEGS